MKFFQILRDDWRVRFLKRTVRPSVQPIDQPTSDEVRSYVHNGLVTGWSEDYPIAAAWLIQFADLIEGEKQ